MPRPVAAILTIGTELVRGLRTDGNGPEIARALGAAGYTVTSIVSVADDASAIAAALEALAARHDLVVATGGLGPTHDDLTREAASHALRRPLVTDASLLERLTPAARRHEEAEAAERVMRQAQVLEGAEVLSAVTGTAPGQVVRAGRATVLLLPGPPREMRPLLAAFLAARAGGTPPVRLRCANVTESDAQVRVARALERHPGVGLTVLASPGEVEVVLFDEGAGAAALAEAGHDARDALGDVCYSDDGASLAEVVVGRARAAGVRIALAESCTGGLVAAAITDVPGASEVLIASIVAYANEAKVADLGVDPELIAAHGAVSAEVARAMASGARMRHDATHAVAVTGIAGPSGGTADKPVGLVWFALATTGLEAQTVSRRFPGDRAAIRTRSTVFALDLLRRALEEA